MDGEAANLRHPKFREWPAMPPFLQYLFVLVAALFGALWDLFSGRTRRRYQSTVYVAAPRSAVWAAASAKSVEFDGPVPLKIHTQPRDGNPTIFDGTVTYGSKVSNISFRVVEERPNEALVIEILPDGRDANKIADNDHFATVILEDQGDGTRFTLIHDLTHLRWLGRVDIPIGVLATARRLKLRAEKDAGNIADTFAASVTDALVTGAITFASFMYLFGWSVALMLIVLILIHELGHVVAMRWCGIPVKGIYFIPFFGGVAVGADRYRSEGERGLVAFMGPGLSLVTTAAFFAASVATGEELWRDLALMSAILNGLNLLPVMPLDGGHIADSLVSRLDPDIGDMMHLLGLLLGFGLAAYMEWYLLGFLLLFQIPRVFSGVPGGHKLPPLALGQTALLFAAYGGALVFYGGIVSKLV